MFLNDVFRFCEQYFLPLTGVFYITAKIIIKYVLRNIASLNFDVWEVISWFGVELSCLNIALSISIKMHWLLESGYAAKYEGIVTWYIFLVFILIVSIFVYAYVNKGGGKLRLIFGNTLLWGIGLGPLALIADIIKKCNAG